MTKPQMHPTSLSTLSRCGHQYYMRYVLGRVFPPGIAAIQGTGTHRGIEANLRNKMATGELLPVEELQDVTRDAVNAEWNRGVFLSPDERREDPEKLRGEAIDTAVTLATIHHTHRADSVNPIAVERGWTVELDGFPFDLAGTIDIQEQAAVIDNKTKSSAPPKNAADTSLQLTAYALAVQVNDKRPVERVELHYLVATSKPYAAQPLVSTRTQAHFDMFLRRVEAAAAVIQSGAFQPANPDDWVCGPKFCGYWDTCPYALRPVSVSMSNLQEVA